MTERRSGEKRRREPPGSRLFLFLAPGDAPAKPQWCALLAAGTSLPVTIASGSLGRLRLPKEPCAYVVVSVAVTPGWGRDVRRGPLGCPRSQRRATAASLRWPRTSAFECDAVSLQEAVGLCAALGIALRDPSARVREANGDFPNLGHEERRRGGAARERSERGHPSAPPPTSLARPRVTATETTTRARGSFWEPQANQKPPSDRRGSEGSRSERVARRAPTPSVGVPAASCAPRHGSISQEIPVDIYRWN